MAFIQTVQRIVVVYLARAVFAYICDPHLTEYAIREKKKKKLQKPAAAALEGLWINSIILQITGNLIMALDVVLLRVFWLRLVTVVGCDGWSP